MNLQTGITINASREQIWPVLTDIENSKETISAIEKIEVLNKPDTGLVGLKWKETRTMFGKQAEETMWITKAEENSFYETEAQSHGMIYKSGFKITENNGSSELVMYMNAIPQSFGAKIMGGIMSLFFKGPTIKAIKQDLQDIKIAVESKNQNLNP